MTIRILNNPKKRPKLIFKFIHYNYMFKYKEDSCNLVLMNFYNNLDSYHS
jgi:hypothetical protein